MKIQALAVAAATLAFAAPALPAHANDASDRLDRALAEAASVHCRVLRNGGTWGQAVQASVNGTEYGEYWVPRTQRTSQSLYKKLIRLKINTTERMCPVLEANAYRRYRIANGDLPSAPTYTGGYSGGTTTIQEDPFEF